MLHLAPDLLPTFHLPANLRATHPRVHTPTNPHNRTTAQPHMQPPSSCPWQAIVPALLKKELLHRQVAEVEAAVAAMPEETDLQYRSRSQCGLRELSRQRDAADTELTRRLDGYVEGLRPELIEAGAPDEQRAVTAFAAVLAEMAPAALGRLEGALRAAGNVGPLVAGAEVEVLEAGQFVRAKVGARAAGNGYTLRRWTEVTFLGDEHTAGYADAPNATAAPTPRASLYGGQPKPVQVLAPGSGSSELPAETDPAFLALLARQCAGAKPGFDAACAAVAAAAPGAVFVDAPIKGLDRAAQKTMEKYKGRYSLVTDLLRGTIRCSDPDEMCSVLEALTASPELEVVRFKDRMCRAFDAALLTSGYRCVTATAQHAQIPFREPCVVHVLTRSGGCMVPCGDRARVNSNPTRNWSQPALRAPPPPARHAHHPPGAPTRP